MNAMRRYAETVDSVVLEDAPEVAALHNARDVSFIKFRMAKAAHQKAACLLIMAAEQAFPVGSKVQWEHNHRGGSSWLIGVVRAHSSAWWYDPGTVYVENTKTGARHQIDAENLRLIEGQP